MSITKEEEKEKCKGETGMGYYPFLAPGHDTAGGVATWVAGCAQGLRAWPGGCA